MGGEIFVGYAGGASGRLGQRGVCMCGVRFYVLLAAPILLVCTVNS